MHYGFSVPLDAYFECQVDSVQCDACCHSARVSSQVAVRFICKHVSSGSPTATSTPLPNQQKSAQVQTHVFSKSRLELRAGTNLTNFAHTNDGLMKNNSAQQSGSVPSSYMCSILLGRFFVPISSRMARSQVGAWLDFCRVKRVHSGHG